MNNQLKNIKHDLAVRWYNFWIDYPAAGYTVTGVKWLAYAGLASLLLFLISIRFGMYGALPSDEQLSRLVQPQATEVYFSDSTLMGRYYFENRSNISYHQISPHLIHALVATEDARFFEHNGIDLRAWGRVFFKSILMGQRSNGGGSTLSQQLAKNLYPRQNFGKYSLIINKAREVFIAMRLEALYDKNQLLELYLNTVPFSENTYGIKVAANRFFNTHPYQLSPEQSAVLIGMLKATALYDPTNNPQFALQRRNLVISQMERYGYLSDAVADSLQALPLELDYYPITHEQGPAPYFREHLRQELKHILAKHPRSDGKPYNLYTDGLKIYTTIDRKLQLHAERALKQHMKGLQEQFDQHLNGADPWEAEGVFLSAQYRTPLYQQLLQKGYCDEAIDSIFQLSKVRKVFSWDEKQKQRELSLNDSLQYYLGLLHAGFLASSPETGQVKAWVGGIDYEYFKYDHVLSKRQAGSTFKPFVYAAALQKGIEPCTYFPNQLRTYARYEGWTPKNSDDKYGGYYSMEGGLINSVNTVTVQLMMQTGPGTVATFAEQMGISTPLPRVPAIALGAAEVSLYDMVNAYGTFANRGVRPEMHYIKRIENQDGKVLVDNTVLEDTCQWERVMWQDDADIMSSMLQAVVDRGTGRRIRWRYQMKQPLAGKTGTSQNHSDGWFIGYTPKLVMGAWVGAHSPGVRFRNLSLGQGANTALPIVSTFVQIVDEDPAYNELVNTKFPRLSSDAQTAMWCPNAANPKQDSSKQQMAASLDVPSKEEQPTAKALTQNVEGAIQD
jgi:penicillin-binding protein 1A